jgi:hypothetical protein
MSPASQSQLEPSLFIATTNSVRYYSQLLNKTLFECDNTDGIVNVRASKDNSGLFAVADSQVVILHDASQDKARNYTLNNGDVRQRYDTCTSPLLTGFLGRTASSPVLARFARSVLHHHIESFRSSLLSIDRRVARATTTTPLATERHRNLM